MKFDIFYHISLISSQNDKCFRQKWHKKSNSHILRLKTFSENRAVYENMWKNIVQRGSPQMTIRRMRTACWVPKATNTHTHVE